MKDFVQKYTILEVKVTTNEQDTNVKGSSIWKTREECAHKTCVIRCALRQPLQSIPPVPLRSLRCSVCLFPDVNFSFVAPLCYITRFCYVQKNTTSKYASSSTDGPANRTTSRITTPSARISAGPSVFYIIHDNFLHTKISVLNIYNI